MRFSVFINPRSVTALTAVAAMLFFASTALGESHPLVHDTFSGRGNLSLADRVPDFSSTGSTWSIEDGAWAVRGGVALDNTKVKEIFSGDRRAIIETGVSDMRITATLKRSGGKEFQGVVGRYAGPNAWIMAFYDGVGDIVLGAKDGTEFIELGRVPTILKNGSRHDLSLSLSEELISVHLDGNQILPQGSGNIVFDGHLTTTKAGIFLRGNGSSRFDEFVVTDD